MTAVLTPANQFAARILSAQPVDKSGEKLGGTGGQPGTCRGERADNQRRHRDSTQQAIAGGVPTHTPCGQQMPGRPGLTPVVPTIHRTYCDYVPFFIYKLHNQQWVAAGATTRHRSGAMPARHGRGIINVSAATYPCARIPTHQQRTGGGSQ